MRSLCRTAVSIVLASMIAAGRGTFAPSAREAHAEGTLEAAAAPYRSPMYMAISPDGKALYVSDPTAGNVTILDTVFQAKRGEVALRGKPHGLALSADGNTLYVAEHGAGSVAVIDTARCLVTSRIAVGRWPTGLAVADASQRLYVCNQDSHTISVIDLSPPQHTLIQQVPVIREPSCLAITPDQRHVVVANLLPWGPGTDPELSAEVSILDCRETGAVGDGEVAARIDTCPRSLCRPKGKMGLRSARLGSVQLAHHSARTRLGKHLRLERHRH